jgi:hypothetical protein
VAGSCERGNELSVSIKGVESLDELRECQFLMKDSRSMGLVYWPSQIKQYFCKFNRTTGNLLY